jgi:HEPN domain-containing protein/predicted nucleotidyltransferase
VNQWRSVAPDVLDEIVRRVVEAAHPERVILFGSAARGEMRPDSDVDLLVIVPGPADRKRVFDAIDRELHRISPYPGEIDLVVVTTEDAERYRDSHPLVIKPALREGKVLYLDREARKRRKSVIGRPRSAIEEEYMAAGRFSPDDPREWLNRARSNLAMAKASVPGVYRQDLCFQAQQAAEKAIKAVMIRRDIEFPYVHDLGQLLNVLQENGEEIPSGLWPSRDLTRFALMDRYPGSRPEPTDEEYREYLSIVEAVVRWAEERVGV